MHCARRYTKRVRQTYVPPSLVYSLKYMFPNGHHVKHRTRICRIHMPTYGEPKLPLLVKTGARVSVLCVRVCVVASRWLGWSCISGVNGGSVHVIYPRVPGFGTGKERGEMCQIRAHSSDAFAEWVRCLFTSEFALHMWQCLCLCVCVCVFRAPDCI